MAGIRIGIAGCGMIGQRYARTLRQLGRPVAAVADPIIERAQYVADLCGAAPYADLRDLLAADAIDLLCVCTPTPDHYSAVMAAIEHRAHIFCEKPLAETLRQAEDMCFSAREAGLIMGMGFKMRYEAVFAKAKALIDTGAIGRPLQALFSYFQQVPPPERIWYTEYGALRDMIPHAIDLSSWYLGQQPLQVSARLDHRLGYRGEDRALLQVDYDALAIATIQGGWIGVDYPPVASTDDLFFQVIGERGYVAGSRSGHLVAATEQGVERVKLAEVDAFRAELEDFFKALERSDTPPLTAAAGLSAQRVIDAAYQSHESERTISL